MGNLSSTLKKEFKKKEAKVCVICGKKFMPYRPQQQCCSNMCRHLLNRKYKEELVTPFVDKVCPICKRVFNTNNPRKRYCSSACYDTYQEIRNAHKKHNETERVCALCGKTFYSSHFMQKYCSHECYDESKVKRATRVRDDILNKE